MQQSLRIQFLSIVPSLRHNDATSGSLARDTILFPPHIVMASNIIVAVNHGVTFSLPLQRCLMELTLLLSLKTYKKLPLIDGSTLEMSRTPSTRFLDLPRVTSEIDSKVILMGHEIVKLL